MNNQNNKYRGFVSDAIDSTTWKIDETTGFLTAPVVLARTGIQTYYGFELGLKDRATDKINVYRSPEEVFSQASIDSYVNLTIVDDHPEKPVTLNNVDELQVGSVSEVKRDGDFLKGIATIKNKKEIEKIKSGKSEVSVGYAQELKPIDRIIDGLQCEFEQTNIRSNHLAVVDAGRCGGECKILNDKKIGYNLSIITIDGIEHSIEDSVLAQAIKKMQKDAEEENMETEKKEKSLEERVKDLEIERDEALKEKEEALAAKEVAEKSKEESTSDSQKLISDRVSKTVKIVTQVRRMLGDKMRDCFDCDLQLMKDAIGPSFSEDEIMGQTPEYTAAYIEGRYKDAVDKFESGIKDTYQIGKDLLIDAKGDEITRDSAYENYKKTFGNGVT